ncbi:MAG: NAD(P)/FAD-dependent oxidoreductase [Acidobacteriota bacterium]|nr:NAD(P)/FAD-dependent oxidoreductase [Acidobacteriota bacterium]
MVGTSREVVTMTQAEQEIEHFDVVIVGAGISGVGSAYHLSRQCPGKTFVVLEGLESFGGTWLVHRYPGIRSDSDLYTFGYRFKPWTGPPIATAEKILEYMGEVIEENDLGRYIRYQHRITAAHWSSDDARWTVEGTRGDDAEPFRVTAGFLWMCQGYYRHAEGFTPDWPGMEDYQGRIVHPQTWPEDLDYRDKEVVVIGSGATTATIVPAMAADCSHITVLQRSPTYFFPGSNRNELADTLREIDIPEEWIHTIVRKKILHDQEMLTRLSVEQPEMVKAELINGVRQLLPEGFDVDTHFTPRYRPWQQRLAFVPDGDLFQGISDGKASVVTDQIARFTEKGVLLESGDELVADIIITATGFNLSILGDISFSIDGVALDLAETVTWRGAMFTGVPNLAWIFGYFRASWTLRSDLIGDLVCRILHHMDEMGARRVTPQLRPDERDAPRLAWMDPENFNPNYLMRSVHLLPKRLDRPEWQHSQDYWAEKDVLPEVDLDDGCLIFD